jgi:SAM-dependent methyltransferase
MFTRTKHNTKEMDENLLEYYDNNLNCFGPTAQGVGWKDNEAQSKRFAQLVKVIENQGEYAINDLGCGVGDLLNYLLCHNYQKIHYQGYDVLEQMVDLAAKKNRASLQAKFLKVEGAKEMQPADYTLASGIFNLKYSTDEFQWLSYILETLHYINQFSRRGFAFNMLTKYSDKEYMRDHLYYADPLFFFDYCKRNYSLNVALLHDYNEYDFTIIVRK